MRVSDGTSSGWYSVELDMYGKNKAVKQSNILVGEMDEYSLGSLAEALQEVVSSAKFDEEGVAGKCRIRIAFGSPEGGDSLHEGIRFWKQRAWFDDGSDGVCVVDLNSGAVLDAVFPVAAIEELVSLVWGVVEE